MYFTKPKTHAIIRGKQGILVEEYGKMIVSGLTFRAKLF